MFSLIVREEMGMGIQVFRRLYFKIRRTYFQEFRIFALTSRANIGDFGLFFLVRRFTHVNAYSDPLFSRINLCLLILYQDFNPSSFFQLFVRPGASPFPRFLFVIFLLFSGNLSCCPFSWLCYLTAKLIYLFFFV